MVLEINVASICASVPIFWPIIRPFFGAILVTREFSVKHEDRDRDMTTLSSRGRTASETELNAHYKDSYVMDLVDPFTGSDDRYQQNAAKHDGRGRKTRRWRWF